MGFFFAATGKVCECMDERVLFVWVGSLENRRRRPATACDHEPELERELLSAGVEAPEDDVEERS